MTLFRREYYIKQQDKFSCGPIAIEMVLKAYRKQYNRELLYKTCNAKPKIGTPNYIMEKAVKNLGLKYGIGTHCTIDALRTYLKKGLFPIVNRLNFFTGNGHFCVVIEITDKKIIFADQLAGYKYSLDIDKFINTWHNKSGKIKRWCLIMGR